MSSKKKKLAWNYFNGMRKKNTFTYKMVENASTKY